MNISIKQFSSMEKIRGIDFMKNGHIATITALKGERISYQVAISSEAEKSEGTYRAACEVESDLKEYIKLYSVENAVMDLPVKGKTDEYHITKEEGLMPDLLIPLEEADNTVSVGKIKSVYVDINLPEDIEAGKYAIRFKASYTDIEEWETMDCSVVMYLYVLDAVLDKDDDFIYTEWFHTDCIASTHNVQVYSEEHWELIDKYMKSAVDMGVNMILTPVFTPALNTKFGYERLCVQLVDIKKTEDKYSFDFSKLGRWIELCKKNGIKYYEISSMFTQWGLKYTPNIYAEENNERKRIFGWQTNGFDEEYIDFLKIFVPELVAYLKEKGVCANAYFHLSDEPTLEHLDVYRKAYNIVKPLIEDCKIFEACSKKEFYDNDVMDIPVVATDRIMPFIESKVDPLFAYYCGKLHYKLSNRYLSMPLYRCRIIGLQLYKYNIKGFLHWGFNFYNTYRSENSVNPYVTTSAGGIYLSGDCFIVYPGKDIPYPTLRYMMMRDAMQELRLLKQAEKYIGREEVVKIIDEMADMDVTFAEYPRNNEYQIELNNKIKKLIAEKVDK